MMTDPIADMLTRIRNAYLVHKKEAIFPYSKIKKAIADIFAREGYVSKVELTDNKIPQIIVALKYDSGQPAIHSLKRISKPGARCYIKSGEINRVLNGLGMAILSTPRGMLTGEEARAAKVGGELICEVY